MQFANRLLKGWLVPKIEHKLLCELIGQSRTEENVSEVSNSSGLEQFGPPKPKPRAWIELFLVCYFRRRSSFAPAVTSVVPLQREFL